MSKTDETNCAYAILFIAAVTFFALLASPSEGDIKRCEQEHSRDVCLGAMLP